ncbi:hypothetical protein I6A84_23150 [Frankia sp. CNm7]|uniref:Uncharacterized protein n=1 Tax=Frankia nepalensis TaxID=1836974 RepID=A0A937RBL0_9ACTN|nr:hypothetical protein [Frankia nepalensis]MBL7499221.1 hypothetical protein [Frankia nepalensis]MBL7512133.1 hypothetical protein [Frankia nepalensis]MBL7520904.1 hypothetical protein [Frankia nepalensis]MBL7627292.1 hypothetical protein [Frankia nepalensis]
MLRRRAVERLLRAAAGRGWRSRDRGVRALAEAVARGDPLRDRSAAAVPLLLDYLGLQPAVMGPPESRPPPDALVDLLRAAARSFVDQAAREAVCARARSGDEEAVAAVRDAGYLPVDEADRAAVLAVTRQWDRYHDLDPDGRLLATVYADAPERTRFTLRAAARADGQADMIRMMLGTDPADRLRAFRVGESGDLVDGTIAAGRHDDLWRLVPRLRYRDALYAAGRLEEAGWRPGRPDEQALFGTLRGALGQTVRDDTRIAVPAHDVLLTRLSLAVRVGQTSLPWQGGADPIELAMAPDGSMVTVVGRNAVWVWNVATGAVHQHAGTRFRTQLAGALPPGPRPAAVVAGGHDRDGPVFLVRGGEDEPATVHALAAGTDRQLGQTPRPRALLPLPADPAASGDPASRARVLTVAGGPTVQLWGTTGELGPARVLPDAGPPNRPYRASPYMNACAISLDGRRLAVVDAGNWAHVYDLTTDAVLGHASLRAHSSTPFHDATVRFTPDGQHLIAVGGSGDVMVRVAPELPVVATSTSGHYLPWSAVVLPRARAVVSVVPRSPLVVHSLFRGAETQTIDVGGAPTAVAASADGDWLAVLVDRSQICAYDLRAARLAIVPLGDATPDDLTTVESLLSTRRESLDAHQRAHLAALAALLRHRLRHEIHLVGAVPVPEGRNPAPAARHDIELGDTSPGDTDSGDTDSGDTDSGGPA